MKHLAFYIVFLGTISLLTSCSFGVGDNTTIVTDLNSDLEISLFQDLKNPYQYFLNISTLESSHCEESILLTTLTERLDEIELEIQGIETPSDCNSFTSRLHSNEYFKYYGKDLDFNITLAKNIENRLSFKKATNSILLESNELNGISFRFSELFQVNPSHFWGGLHSEKEEEKALFYQLYSTITEQAVYHSVEEGNYGYFISEEKTTVMHPEQLQPTETAFAIEFDPEFNITQSPLADIILDFRMSHPELDFFILDGNGQEY